MSYAIAPTFEGNSLGRRNFRTLSGVGGISLFGLGTLGATPGDYDNNQQVLGQLVAMGAITQQNATDIWNGDASLDDMAVNMTMINQALQMTGQAGSQTVQPLPINPTVAPPPPSSPGSGVASATASGTQPSTAQVPSGSALTYTVQWSASVLNPLTGASQAISAMQSKLPNYGMSLLGSTTNSLPVIGGITGLSITLSVLDTVGHALLSDAKSVLDGLMQQIVGNNLSGSNLAIAKTPNQSAAGGAPQPQTLTQWFEQNAAVIGIGFAALVAMGIILERR